ncbi:alpha-N-acetylgalactosaminide alpha-2,6-sialyltransferase 3 [Discoglossus pictus]
MARIVWECLEEHVEDFQVLSWPPNSPDFNPIRHRGTTSNAMFARVPIVAVSSASIFVFLIVFRVVNEVNVLKVLTYFGQISSRFVPVTDAPRRPSTYHDGYINIKTFEPLQLDCGLCAVVSNSGQMLGQKIGYEIDQSSCIWRMNNAPTKGYTEDVGNRTTIRMVSHTSVPLLLKDPDYFFKEKNDTIYVIWGPFNEMRSDGKGVVYNMLKKTSKNYSAKIYITTQTRMNYCDSTFKLETGKDRQKSGTYLSTGWFTMMLAMDACYGIHVYGMVNDTYCKSDGFRNVPYHYYESGSTECEEYLLHEYIPAGGHRFITEKRVFAKWAKQHNITFTHPDWIPY